MRPILCGSHVGFIEREVPGRKSPLFGRRNDQIKLGPLPYPEAARMVDHYSDVDKAGVYFVVGGMAYLERFTAGRFLHRAICEEFCSELKFLASIGVTFIHSLKERGSPDAPAPQRAGFQKCRRHVNLSAMTLEEIEHGLAD